MEHKTNVMRELDKLKINYNHYCYANTDAISGIEVASVLNQNPEMVFKTLVTVGKSKKYYVFMLPVAKELDLKNIIIADLNSSDSCKEILCKLKKDYDFVKIMQWDECKKIVDKISNT